jgi:NAD(P)-dependent dehydrogenase (short-subunit alcohol dehydrogenase family)
MKLLDKVAVITGGSSGIGLATARSELEQARKQIGRNVTAVQGDVADLDRLYRSTTRRRAG